MTGNTEMSNEIAIVYGASGFLGSHVADALSTAGYRVRLFDRRPSLYQLTIRKWSSATS